MNRKTLSYLLAFVMILTTLPTSLLFAQENIVNHLIINQVYGGGGKGDNPISHSFIELYNPTENNISLEGYEIIYSCNRGDKHAGHTGGTEEILELADIMLPARTSYLVIGAVENTTPSVYGIENLNLNLQSITTSSIYKLGAADQEWPGRHIDNDQYIVKLKKDDKIIDAVTVNTKETATEGAQIPSISKQKTIRRVNFQDTDNNAADFEVLEYKDQNSEFIEKYRPRSLNDGAWGDLVPEVPEPVYTDKIPGCYNDTASLKLELIARYDTGKTNKDGGVAEIVKYNPDNKSFYAINGFTSKLDIVSIADLKTGMEKAPVITTAQSIDLKDIVQSEVPYFTYGDLTSVDISTKHQAIAVAVQAEGTNAKGYVSILDYDGRLIKLVEAGVQPDMLTFTPDGNYILVANEGEPREGYGADAVDPKGSVTIINLQNGIENADSTEVTFDAFDSKRDELIENKVILKKGAMPSVDLEPEYIVVNSASTKAYVALQEANAIATLDIASKQFESIKGLGFKDHSKAGNEIDLINNGSIEIKNQDVLGVYMPDGISIYEKDGRTYILTANEGDAREWGSYKNLSSATLEGKKVDILDSSEHDGLEEGKTYLLGARSFSIWDAADMSLVYDSGSDFEKKTAELIPDYFNCSNSNVTKDNRSGKKGPEPEDIKVAKIGDKVYAYIGLERIGGIMVYDITNPRAAKFVNYINSRDYSDSIAGDVSPEGLCSVLAADSPTGTDLLLVANEVSGTVAVYEVTKGKDETALNDNKLSIISDIHIYARDLGIEGKAFQDYIDRDRKMIAESELILDAAIERIAANDSKIVLVAGDLTKDGEAYNHKLVASKLKGLKDIGKRVFVINGNHDISNAKSVRYEGDSAIRIPTISREDFREIYKEFGYDEAIVKDDATLSYVVDLTPEYRLIVVDTAIYNNDVENPSSKTAGEIKPETLTWIKEQIKSAHQDGKKAVGMMHHGLVPHTEVQPVFFPEYLINDYQAVTEELADAGLLAVFTGHFHSQDISAMTTARGNKIYDIETGSTVTYPVPIRHVLIDGDTLNITSEKIDNVPGLDLKGKTFDEFAFEFLMSGLELQVPEMLAGVLISQAAAAGQVVSPEAALTQAKLIANSPIPGTPYRLGKFLASCMAGHYIGDEKQDPMTQAIIGGFLSHTDPMYKLLGDIANKLTTDTDAGTDNAVPDNNAVIKFMPLITEEPDRTFTITYTNDMHGRVFPDPNNTGMIGIDKIAAIHKATKNSILVDIGDTIHGLPIANTTQGKNIIELLGLAGYELMVPGNHDFNYGSDKLKQYAEDTKKGFDIISANIINKADGSPYLPGTAIREVNGVKVGFFGLTTQTTPIVTNPVNVETLEFTDYVPASQEAIKKLKNDGAELIVALAHVSRADMKVLASHVKDDVAVIIDAHDHISTDEIVDGVLIASAGQYEESIGQIVFELDENNQVRTKTAKLIKKADTKDIIPDAAVKARAEEMMAKVSVLFNEKLGISEVFLDSTRGSATTKGVRNSEMSLGNLVTDAMREVLGTDIALTNGGGLRANIEKGEITRGHLNAVLPFGNFGVVKEVTPKALKEILENGVKVAPEALGGFPQVSGMKFEYNPNAAAGSKVTKITIGNTVLNLNDTSTKYKLATNDFMANGGDGYTAIKLLPTLSNGDSLDNIFETYLKDTLKGKITSRYAQTEGRIVAAVPSTGSSGNSGGSSGGSAPTTPVKEEQKVPVALTSVVKQEISKDAVQKLIANNPSKIEIKLEVPAGATKVTAEFSKEVFSQLAQEAKSDVLVNAGVALITLNNAVINNIAAAAGGNINITVEKVSDSSLSSVAGDRPIYDFTIKAGDRTISSFGNESIKVAIPYTLKAGEDSNAIVIYYIDDAKQLVPVMARYNTETKTVDFVTKHFSKYMIGYNPTAFGDTQNHWANKNIQFVTARGLFGGVENDKFGPNGTMTRGMLVTVLGRMVNAKAAGQTSFTDVSKAAYYAPYVAWAVEAGIVGGIGDNKFAPEKAVTREEMAVIMSNYIKYAGYSLSSTQTEASSFSDNTTISPWATDAVAKAQSAGLITGKENNKFDPKGQSSRAEVAVVLQRVIEKSTK